MPIRVTLATKGDVEHRLRSISREWRCELLICVYLALQLSSTQHCNLGFPQHSLSRKGRGPSLLSDPFKTPAPAGGQTRWVTSAASDRYRRLATRFTSLVSSVPVEAWTNPSPCVEWTAVEVFHHVVTTEADLYSRMSFGSVLELGLTEPHDPAALATAWTQVREVIQSTLDAPEHSGLKYEGFFGPTTFAETVDRFYSFDLVVHCWDLARATGKRAYEVFDPAEIAKCQTDFADLSDTMRQPGLLDPELTVADDADEATKFLAFLGRANN